MSEDPKSDPDEATADAATDDGGPVRKRPSPGASAASRARRIGGRPASDPRPKPAADATAAPATPAPAKKSGPAVNLDKLSTRKPGRAVEHGAELDAEALRRRLDRLRWIPAGVLGAAVVVLAVLCVLLGNGVWRGTKSASYVRGQVLAAAKTCTATVSSYDYRKLAQSKKDGRACATGKFKADYTTAMDTIIAKEAPKTKTTQTLQVAKAGIEQVSSDGNQWTLLIYGQHTVTNTTTETTNTPRLDKLSVRVTMDKVGGKWLIAKIDIAS